MIERHVLKIRRRGRPAPAESPEQWAEKEARRALEPHIDAICHAWADWVRTRRFYGPPAGLPSIIGKLRTRTPPATDGSGGPNAEASAELAYFNLAVIAGGEGRDRLVFELHYRFRPRSIKQAAEVIGVGRQHWYTLRNAFARRAWVAHRGLMDADRLSPEQATTNRYLAGDILAQNSRRFV